MPDMFKLQQQKERILSTINTFGPSFPARISRQTGISPLFVSAFLSELVSERKLKISNMKVGSSPLYYIEGQEENLEKFVEFLNNKEREAFQKLKEASVLSDEKQEPAIRVALRKIKDFAIPVNVKINGETKLFWKHFSNPDLETKEKIEDILGLKKVVPKVEEKIEEEVIEEVKPKKTRQKKEKPIEQTEKIEEVKPKKDDSEFASMIKEYMKAKDIEILEEVHSKKKEFISKVRIDTPLGKQDFYLISKDKKKISANDLTIALQHAQHAKMPALFVAPGDLDKKAQSYIEEWRNLIKFQKVE